MRPLYPGDILKAKKMAVGGKRPRCQRGKSCAAACIARIKFCLVALNSLVSQFLAKASSNVASRKRIRNAVEEIKRGMEGAIKDNDRARYDKLEAKLFRIRSKVGASMIRDLKLRSAAAGEMWEKIKEKSYLPNLRTTLNEGKRKEVSEVKVFGRPNNFMVVSKILGNELAITVIPNDTTIFEVNGSLKASNNLSKKEAIAIVRETKRQYAEIFKGMKNGTVFEISSASDDDRKSMREGGYMDIGFSKPDRFGSMYGMIKDGGIVPITKEDYKGVGG